MYRIQAYSFTKSVALEPPVREAVLQIVAVAITSRITVAVTADPCKLDRRCGTPL